MLNTGARYFEFRPAHISSKLSAAWPLPDKMYYTHLVIPGTPLDALLAEVVHLLLTNPTEIVVVQIRHDGIDSSCTVATTDEVNTYVANALKNAAPLTHGTFQDMLKSSYADLLSQCKPLIVLQDGGGGNTAAIRTGHTLRLTGTASRTCSLSFWPTRRVGGVP